MFCYHYDASIFPCMPYHVFLFLQTDMAFFCPLILQKLPMHLSTVRLLKSAQKRMEQPLKEN